MRTNKIAIAVLSPLTLVALISAYILHCYTISFWENICIGIFGSGLLSDIIAIISYANERTKTLEDFWSYGHKAINNINKYKLSGSLDQRIDSVLAMHEFDYQPFDDAFGGICFLFFNKRTRMRIGKEIYEPIWKLRQEICKKVYHFQLYKDAEGGGNTKVMESMLSELDDILVISEPIYSMREDGTQVRMGTFRSNKLVEPLRETYNGFYYKLMYPFKKVEDTDNAN